MIDSRRYASLLPGLADIPNILSSVTQPDGSPYMFVTDAAALEDKVMKRDAFLHIVDGDLKNRDLETLKSAILMAMQEDASGFLSDYDAINITILENKEFFTPDG